MFDFRRNSHPPNYLGSPLQRRLLVLAALAACAAGAWQTRGSPLAQWLIGPAANDTQRSRVSAPVLARSDDASAAEARRETTNQPADPRDARFPGVRDDYLSTVQDDTPFRADESDAWYHLLALLESSEEQSLDQASLGRVGYVQLDQQAKYYRGRLVTIDGVVRAAKLVTAPQNAFGIDRYYQLWLQPQRNSPALVVVYALQLPPEFPLGEALEAECEATGFFYKRWAYQSNEGIRTAPVILARTIDWQAPSAPMAAPAPLPLAISLAVALTVGVAAFGLILLRARGRRARGLPADSEQVAATLAAADALAGDASHTGAAGADAAGADDPPAEAAP